MRNCIILGSGRSGTSLTCGLLRAAGYYMGDGMIPPDEANPGGYFESIKINRLNEDILKAFVPERWKGKLGDMFTPGRTLFMQRWLNAIDPSVTITAGKAYDERIRYFTSQPPFCFKDPRFSYTLPVWQRSLGSDTAYICVFRNPLDVSASMVKEAMRDSQMRKVRLRFTEKDSLKVWKAMYGHVLKAYGRAEHKSAWTFIWFDQLVAGGDALDELEKKLEVKTDRSFIDTRFDHSKKRNNRIPDPEIDSVYRSLLKLAGAL
jgi:hypothetical protein